MEGYQHSAVLEGRLDTGNQFEALHGQLKQKGAQRAPIGYLNM